MREEHEAWDESGNSCSYPSTAAFEDSHCAFLAATTRATALGRDGLDVAGVDDTPTSDCPICSPLANGKYG